MEFKQIQYFACLYEEGTVTRAANRLNIVQPALSAQLKNLECSIGELLFTRSSKGMHPTPAGRRMYQLFQPLLEEFERSKNQVSNSHAELSGNIRIGVISSIAESILAKVVNEFTAKHPRVSLSITEGFSEALCDLVAGGQLEAAIINRPRTRLTLRNDPMLDEEIVLVSGAKADIGKENLALKKVLGLKMVLPTKQHGLRKILDSITSSENLELSPIHEIDSINAIMQLVEISDYVTLLPQLALKGASSMKLSMNSIHSPGLTRQISCVSHPRRPLNAAVASFIEICSRFSIETHTK